jgi:hypothetical protein
MEGSSPPYRLAVDSGSWFTLLDARAAKLGLKPSGETSITGAGSGETKTGVLKNVTIQTTDDDNHRLGLTDPAKFEYRCNGAILPLMFGGVRLDKLELRNAPSTILEIKTGEHSEEDAHRPATELLSRTGVA